MYGQSRLREYIRKHIALAHEFEVRLVLTMDTEMCLVLIFSPIFSDSADI